MIQKCNIIRSTSEIQEVIGNEDVNSTHGHTILSSKHYAAVACDLSDISALKTIMSDLQLESKSILFVGEVSMTYMEVKAADAVIKLVSGLPDSRFCLLEQWMPEGPSHPFASTMLQHFDKLNSQLKSPLIYQDAQSQRKRFLENGWRSVQVQNLWNLWSDDDFISVSERQELEILEPFDEWEEFALFGSHYFLLIADSRFNSEEPSRIEPPEKRSTQLIKTLFSPYRTSTELHRHSAVFRGSQNIICQGGYGTRGRLTNTFLYSIDRSFELNDRDPKKTASSSIPQLELVCHTICKLGATDVVIIGGRKSPKDTSKSCFWRCGDSWINAPDLPEGRFRHCSVCVNPKAALVFGGKDESGEALASWLYWLPGSLAWQELPVVGEKPPGRFAASLSVNSLRSSQGHLAGGLTADGKVLQDLWKWELVESDHDVVAIRCTDLTSAIKSTKGLIRDFGRFGASLVELTSLYLVGGIGTSELVPKAEAILQIDEHYRLTFYALDTVGPLPLHVGHSLELTGDETNTSNIALLGGGALCFSFGTFWNKGVYTLQISERETRVQPWTIISGENGERSVVTPPRHSGFTPNGVTPNSADDEKMTRNKTSLTPSDLSVEGERLVYRTQLAKEAVSFDAVLANSRPAIFESLDFGRCSKAWDTKYLNEKIGGGRKVVVHSSPTANMDFLTKNFEYKTMAFEEFTAAAEAGERVYLRTLSSEKPAGVATSLKDDFPSISDDFSLPDELAYVTANEHSSPLRITGQVNIWLHYDVLSNVYCQVRGRKRLVLFHPSKVDKLQFPPGASSSSIKVFDKDGSLFPEMLSLSPYICDLAAGEVLLIPALWPHAAYATDSMSIAVNVFFCSLAGGYSTGKDVYGNRDIQSYDKGRKDIQRMLKSFRNLPEEYGQFYLKRLASELSEAAATWEA